MANINLTPDDITRESLRILHQKLNFCGNIVRDYDDRYADEGAKIGDSLRVRLPLQYATGTGATMTTTAADSIGTSTTLQVSSQRHVPMRFTSKEMTMDIDSFSQRHVEPAMAKLAAMIENDVLTQAKNNVANLHMAATVATPVFKDVMECRKILQNNLAPMDSRTALIDTQLNVDIVESNKTLFNDTGEISKQYKEGYLGRFGGFTFYENTLIPQHTNGAEGAGVAYDVLLEQSKTLSASDNDPTTMTLNVDVGTLSIAAGDVFTIATVNEVHHETKADTGRLRQFVATAALTGAGALSISPAIIATGPHKNVTNTAPNNGTITFVSGVASTAHNVSLLFQKGFAAFATADLVLPKGTDMASRQTYDGISMRLVRDYAVVKDQLLTRIDVLYGFKVLRPELAVRLMHT